MRNPSAEEEATRDGATLSAFIVSAVAARNGRPYERAVSAPELSQMAAPHVTSCNDTISEYDLFIS